VSARRVQSEEIIADTKINALEKTGPDQTPKVCLKFGPPDLNPIRVSTGPLYNLGPSEM